LRRALTRKRFALGRRVFKGVMHDVTREEHRRSAEPSGKFRGPGGRCGPASPIVPGVAILTAVVDYAPVQQPMMAAASSEARSVRSTGGWPNWLGSLVTSMRRVLLSLSTTTDPAGAA
jgi:hypothetical protein